MFTLGRKLTLIALLQTVLLAIVFMAVGRLVNGPPPYLDAADHDTGARPPPHWVVSPLNTLFVGGFLILGIGSWLTARSVVRPLRKLSAAANEIGAGNLRAKSGFTRADELGDLARAFDTMGEKIERLVFAEKELLANVSHELRTPLARIHVALDIAAEGDPETARALMAEIAHDLTELETLIDDILTTTRLEITRGSSDAAHFDLHVEEIAPSLLCERSAERLRSRHPTRPLEVAVAPDLATVHADPILFRRVLDNLIENAHKYSPEEASAIVLRATAAGDDVVFEVQDHGLGIAADDLPRIFTPFFRADASRTRGTGGVGLGLTLAKRIVEAHHGTITITSALGKGTTVRVVLPRASAVG